MPVRNTIKRIFYRDSAALMYVSNRIETLDGVTLASIVMATDANKDVLRGIGLLTEDAKDTGPNDLIIAVKAESADALDEAIAMADRLLKPAAAAIGEAEVAPRSFDSALGLMPDANFVLISVPGAFAKLEALRALRNGLNVFLFSDGVLIQDELELKQIAREKGLLMMGPECGTAIINNVGLGFANVVREGSIGIVGAAGTGIQQVAVLIHREGLGISQAIGTGGRDLSRHIGGVMTVEGIRALAQDQKTEVIVLISKTLHPEVEKKVLEAVKEVRKPIVVNFLGGSSCAIQEVGAVPATTLEEAAIRAVSLAKGQTRKVRLFTKDSAEIISIGEAEYARLSAKQRYVRGLFSGGSLCHEAMLILAKLIGDVYSNVPLEPLLRLKDTAISQGHTCVDMGEAEFTVGRPHPIIDPSLRERRLLQEAEDHETAVVLLDLVLGYGAHPDPAGVLGMCIEKAKDLADREGRHLSVVASIVGTDRDPQDLKRQEEKLLEAGVIVMPSNSQAARMTALIATRGRIGNMLFTYPNKLSSGGNSRDGVL
jgi:succinyl-CoA synthetase alpha subunit